VVKAISVNLCYSDCRITLSPHLRPGRRRIDVYLPKEQDQRFREAVFKRKGMKKGNISEATQEAILMWMSAPQPKKKEK
jgi:hypothetical protein